MTANAAHITMDRPVLTMPEAEADWIRAAYTGAGSILEYGSGGSTVMASEMAEKSVLSVESDPDWARMMQDWFRANPGRSTPRVLHADIGETEEWGMPANNRKWRRFPEYALGVWDLDDFTHPDVVLVDGRFRVACVLATLFRCEKPVSLYFDDYTQREPYHAVETFVPVSETRGRMARFDINPGAFPKERLLEVIQLMSRPR